MCQEHLYNINLLVAKMYMLTKLHNKIYSLILRAVTSHRFRKDIKSLDVIFEGCVLLKVKLFTKKQNVFRCQNSLEFFS